ncbi:hypothetical protein J2W79_001615 [Methylorubrum extorquens]|nr:hypothetical protein [Methylorubrum extorquens]
MLQCERHGWVKRSSANFTPSNRVYLSRFVQTPRTMLGLPVDNGSGELNPLSSLAESG